MIPPTSIDGTDITGATIDGTDVTEITVDGQTVFSAAQIPNAVGHRWKADEGSGSTVGDSIGTGDLSYNGSWGSGEGNGNAYLQFDGSNDRAFLGTSDFDFDDFSWAMWFNPETLGLGQNMVTNEQGPTNGFNYAVGIGVLGGSSGALGLFGNDMDGGSNINIETSSVTSGNWQFVAFTGDNGTELTMYYADKNDSSITKVGSQNYDTGLKRTCDGITFGADDDNDFSSFERFYDGKLDDVMAAMGTALTQNQIQDIFDITKNNY